MNLPDRPHHAAVHRGFLALFALLADPLLAARVEPSNLPAGFCDLAVAADLAVTSLRVFDTDIECDSVITQTGAPALCVVRFRNVTIGTNGVVRASGSRALVIAASLDVVVQGRIEINGVATGAGAPSSSASGAGGAGHGSNGASGGPSGGLGGTPGGSATGNAALVPLTAGARGGQGGGGAAGGAGGGAVQLVACGDFLLEATGTIEAHGNGGAPGAGGAAQTAGFGGAGGGSGGGILIEGETVALLGRIAANGGGGGGGGSGGTFASSGNAGGNGQNGGPTTTRALGGPGGSSAPTGGNGGAGGAIAQPSGGLAGASGTFSDGGGGGGGGAAGRIRINTCLGLANNAVVVSPAPSTGNSCPNLVVLFADGFEG